MKLSKIQFNYKKNNMNPKKFLMLQHLETQRKLLMNDNKSIQRSLSVKQIDTNKVKTIDKLMDKNIPPVDNNNNNNNHIEIKLYDSVNINTDLIDNIQENGFENGFENSFEAVHYNINKMREKGICVLNNVYQSKYNYGISHCTGLGDFIRGCYFILEFCDKHGFKPKIVFNNCISNFLSIKTRKLELIENVLTSIDFFKANNISSYNIQNGVILEPIKDNVNIMADFVDYMSKSPVYYSNVFMFCNSFPMADDIPEKNKEYMRNILEPTPEMKQHVYDTLGGLDLFIKEYIVIHVRSGDTYLKNESSVFGMKYIEKLVGAIRLDIRVGKYLIIADNNSIKIALKNIFPDFKILLKEITHFGEGIVLEEEKVRNSLVDFYLFSYSSAIFSYSCYEHGSGFSSWCAKTYDIPYMCRLVK